MAWWCMWTTVRTHLVHFTTLLHRTKYRNFDFRASYASSGSSSRAATLWRSIFPEQKPSRVASPAAQRVSARVAKKCLTHGVSWVTKHGSLSTVPVLRLEDVTAFHAAQRHIGHSAVHGRIMLITHSWPIERSKSGLNYNRDRSCSKCTVILSSFVDRTRSATWPTYVLGQLHLECSWMTYSD